MMGGNVSAILGFEAHGKMSSLIIATFPSFTMPLCGAISEF